MRDFMRKEWNLGKIYFASGPPDITLLERVFTGRENELSAAMILLIDAPFKLLLNGLFGVGKTVLIKELKRRSQSETKNPPLFVTEKMYSGDNSIEYTVLRGLVFELKNENDLARNLDITYLGQTIQSKYNTGEKNEIGGGPGFLKGKITQSSNEEVEIFQKEISDPIPIIRRLIAEAQNRYPNRRIIISIDDIDRDRDTDRVRELLSKCRGLLQDSLCSFIFTGHPIGVTRDAYTSESGIYDRQILLQTFDKHTMLCLVARYLGAGRVKKWSSLSEPHFKEEIPTEEDLIPFTHESIDFIIEQSYGIPRILNIICSNILQEAAIHRIKRIDLKHLQKCWDACRKSLSAAVSPDLRNLLELMANKIKIINIENIPDSIFDELHTDTQGELMKQLDFAIKRDLLITNDGREFVLNSILSSFERVHGFTAEVGKVAGLSGTDRLSGEIAEREAPGSLLESPR